MITNSIQATRYLTPHFLVNLKYKNIKKKINNHPVDFEIFLNINLLVSYYFESVDYEFEISFSLSFYKSNIGI